MTRCFIVVLCIIYSPLGLAWNGAGHRIVALIAWQQMGPAARVGAIRLLESHPEHASWLRRARTPDAAQAAFVEASTWPDDLRDDKRFFDEGREAPTPAIPGLADTHRHRDWHFVDLDDNGAPIEGELDRQIPRLAGLLSNHRVGATERAVALAWLLHLVADLHQPLHVGRRGDRGGNLFEIEDPDRPRLKVSNLHRWWDDLPGPPWLRGTQLERRVRHLGETQPLPASTSPSRWMAESRQLSEGPAYPPTPRITPDFRRQAQSIADRRLFEAGVRLGRWLDRLLVSRETPYD